MAEDDTEPSATAGEPGYTDEGEPSGYTDDDGHSMGEHDEVPPETTDVQQAVLDIVRRSARRQTQVQTFLVAVALLTAGIVIGSLWFIIGLQQQLRADAIERADDEKERRKNSGIVVADAIADIGTIINDRIDVHDTAMHAAHAIQLDQIAQLLGRPAGIPVDPVTARGVGGAPTPPPAPRATSTPAHPAPRPTTPRPAPRPSQSAPAASQSPPSAPAPAPATTTPDEKSCAKRPQGPRC